MEWKQQFEIFEKIIAKELADRGEKFTHTNASKLLEVPLHKYLAWKKGQRPVGEDLRRLAQNFEFKPDWLLLGIGEPKQQRLSNPFNDQFVETCDTLHELVRELPDKLPKIAEVGGISTTDLYDCIHTQAFPPSQAIRKWILHYRINANFLLAQIGKPFLTEEEFHQSGPLDWVRNRRGDFLDIDASDEDKHSTDDVDKSELLAKLLTLAEDNAKAWKANSDVLEEKLKLIEENHQLSLEIAALKDAMKNSVKPTKSLSQRIAK